ncbi:hypothetical protein SAMN04488570_3488 [Nocardioides scoriae]|uniref:Bacteriocin biosynthesis cyclodehydratase domain-containing protein n=1 Tax=Nocardioides scoriae TaxID=642780 RepID=A0A1H1XH99_9ACTN|nr:hypothetical protein [Nocardioides scoriae]SDT08645.1 hypothetical protein SAMN04488570_3488 [Nocardioides scoriae]
MTARDPGPGPLPSPAPTPGPTSGPLPALALAPGLRVVRRGRSQLQVGLDPDRRVVLPRTPGVQDVLRRLAERRPLAPGPTTERVLERLRERDCLRPAASPAVAEVALLADLPDGGRLLDDLVAGSASLRVTAWPHEADVVVVVAAGELDRAVLDPLVRASRPHLVLRLLDGGAVLGPFVDPGRTACLRCVDAHRTLADPDHPAVTDRYVEAGTRPRPDAADDLVDRPLLALVSAWAVRDVVAHAAGREPSSWSTERWWHPGSTEPEVRPWSRHPACGCAWSATWPEELRDDVPADTHRSGTMEA